jgi:DNA invertase Pin-like site-specific DNA recombinase
MTGKVVGYVRVSAADQNPARQLEALGTVDKLFTDKASGKDTDRPQLEALIDYIRDDDTVKVRSVDRLARSTTDLLAVLKRIQAQGASVVFLENPSMNTDTPQGEFMLTILAAVAQLERATIRERQLEGIAVAKAKGVYKGRKAALTADQAAELRDRHAAGERPADLARSYGVSRQTVYRYLATPPDQE